ncbi:MAG: hypothetical protein HND58_05085 [Planctomycetota bacterium]|nr:MAG: hypothetical protein HND58_05085 [Planctomycetota bacterium]
MKFGDGVLSKTRGYSADRAVGDGLKTLATSGDVLSHLETIRRMAVYLDRDEGAGEPGAGAVAGAGGGRGGGRGGGVGACPGVAGRGVFAGALSHIGTGVGWKPGYAQGVQGLTWLERAAEAAGESEGGLDVGAVYFAAALVSHPAMRESKRDLYERFMREALGRAERGSLLAKNIEAHLEHFDESAASFRSAG